MPEIKQRSIDLEWHKDYSKHEFVTCGTNDTGQVYKGYKESDEVNEWLTKVFGEECFMIRADGQR